MRKRFILLGAGLLAVTYSHGQIKKHFSVEDDKKVEEVNLNFSVNNGTCLIKPSPSVDILNVYSFQAFNNYSHSFEKTTTKKTCTVNLSLQDNQSHGLSRTISNRVFNKNADDPNKLWRVYLSQCKQYNLNLHYGIGTANVDLSGLAVEKLKIHTGSADVNIGYFSGEDNQMVMDTFYVKVDMGAVNVLKLNNSKAKHVVADIGFGNLTLDFRDKPTIKSDVKGSVGAGNLFILLPAAQTPVMVKVNNSWLCKVQLTKSFTKLEDNTFVNKAYREDAENLLTFELDVSMGRIIFTER